MPDINKKYAVNSYGLLKNAYGNKLPVSEEDFYSKIKNDTDGSYRRNIYNLLHNKYGEKVSSVSVEEFSGKFFTEGIDPAKEKSEQKFEVPEIDLKLEQSQKQLSLIEKGEQAELPPEEYFEQENAGTGLYRKSKEKELTKKYWKEQNEILSQQKTRIEREKSVVKDISGLDENSLSEIKSLTSKELIEKGYNPDVIQYVKREKHFNERKESIQGKIKESPDATLNLSLFNYEQLKENLPAYNKDIDETIKNSEFSKISNYDDRIEALQKEADIYAEKHKDERSEDKSRKLFYAKVSPYVLFDDDGSPSMFAMQNMSKITQGQIEEEILSLQKQVGELYRKQKTIANPYTPQEGDDQIRILNKQIDNLKLTQNTLDKSINKPLARGKGIKGAVTSVGEGISDTDWEDQLTLGMKSMVESIDLLALNQKYKSGNQLTSGEQSILDALGIMNYTASKMDVSNWYDIGQGVAQMPAYMVGFAIGSPLYTSTKKVAAKEIGKVVKKVAIKGTEKALSLGMKKFANWAITKGIPGAVGTIPSTLANPSTSVIKNAATRMTDVANIALTDEIDEIYGEFIQGTGEKFGTALRKGATEAYTENLFERSGTALLQGLGYYPKELIKPILENNKGGKFFKKLLIGEYVKLKGINPKTLGLKENGVRTALKTVGFNGMVEEMFEEYGTNIANGILNGDDMGFDLETFATTLGTVALWGGALGTVNRATYEVDAKLGVKATYQDLAGKEKTIRIPTNAYKQILELEKKEDISGEDIQKVIGDNKLNDKQTSFVLKWYASQIQEGIIKEAKAESKKQTSAKDVPVESTEKPEAKKEEKKKEIKKEEKKIIPTTKDDAVKKNQFDDLTELEEIAEEQQINEVADKKKADVQEKITTISTDIKEKYHDPKAKVDEMIDFNQLGENASITVQREVDKEKINIPAQVTALGEDFARIKYNDGVEDIIIRDSNFSLFSNEKEVQEVDEEGKEKVFLSKQNKGNKKYVPSKLSTGKYVYTKPIKVEGVEGEYGIFKNEDGSLDIVNEKGEIQKFEKPKGVKIQKGTIDAFKQSKMTQEKPEVNNIEKRRKIALDNIKETEDDNKIDFDSGNREYTSKEGKNYFYGLSDFEIEDEINEFYNAELEKTTIKEEKDILKVQEKGQIIYATAGTGKTTLAKQQPDKYVDADVLIAEEIKNKIDEFIVDQNTKESIKKLNTKDPGSKFGQFIFNLYKAEQANNIPANRSTMEDVYKTVKSKINELKTEGKNILTGSPRFISFADKIFTEDISISEKRKGRELGTIPKKEAEEIKKVGKEPIPLKGRFIEETIEKPIKKIPEQKEIAFEKLEEKGKSALKEFAKQRIKNLEKSREEKKGRLQIGIPFVDETTAILFWKGVEKFADAATSLKNLFDKIKEWIKTDYTYTEEELDKIYDNIDNLTESEDENIIQLKEIFSSENPNYQAPESVSSTIEEKVNAHRKAFSSLFENVAKKTGNDKRIIEKKFFTIVQSGIFDEIKNQYEYKNVIKKAKEEYPKYTELFEEMDLYWDYPRAVSLMNFYRSIRLIEQHGIVFTKKDGVKIKSLNSDDFTNDLSNMFKKHINNILFRTNDDKLVDDPNKAIKSIIVDYRNNLDKIRKKSNSERKIEEFNTQLELLQKLTGIDKTVWEDYFSPITKETSVLLKKVDDNGNEKYEKVVFKDYRSLLKYDPSILNNGNYKDVNIISGTKLSGTYINNSVYYFDKKGRPNIKKAPAIINSLTQRIDQSTLSSVKENLYDFMTKGDEKNNVYSNIKKLASSITGSGSISIDGTNVQGKRFNSFILMSHALNAVENVHKSNIDNPVTKMYRDKNIPMKISIINGIDNKKNGKAIKSDKITEGEYWLTQMIMFQNASEGKYKGVLGQVGDKKDIYITDVKHYERTNIDKIKDEFDNVNEVRKFFSKIMIKGIRIGMFSGMTKSNRDIFVDNFIYNFTKNMKDILEIFHGTLEKNNYKNLTDLVKRTSSTFSPGYQLDLSVEGGVGKKFKFVSALDNIDPDELGLSKEQFDGILFYSGKMGDKLSVSMGDMYNKKTEYDGPLTSVKALFSTQKNKKRGLTKTNWVNIDVISAAYSNYPDHYSHKLKKFIDKNNIDALSFNSGTKKLEKGEHLILFDKDGGVRNVPAEEINSHVIDRNTSDIYIQQDLRHPTELTRGKQSTQLMANILALGHAPEMVSEMNDQVNKILDLLNEKLSSIDNTQDKLGFLLKQLETQDQDELSELIERGVTLHDAGYKNMMQSILSSYFTKKGLQKLSNRITTQELPSDKNLKGYRPSENGKYTLLSQIDTGIKGIRYQSKFESQEKALEEYNSNKEKYSDINEWEIEDGIIPGEYILSTRVPADNLHSHTLGRARVNLNGNFTVLDKESQARSGSDYDGDQRFNQVLFKKKGKIINKGIEGNANNFLMNLVKDYQNPDNLERILHPIDTNFFDSIIPKENIEYTYGDPHGLNDARKKNIVGVTMKGILSDLSTMSALIANHNIGTKKSIKINKELFTSKFAKDKDGSLRNAIGILLNLAFDNAKDPKIEALGLNEITANMFILLMISDPKIDTVTDKESFIKEKVKTISEYFNSPMLIDFIRLQRESNGVLSNLTNKDIFDELSITYQDSFTTSGKSKSSMVKTLKELFYSAGELTELKRFYSLTKQFPNNVSELLQILNTVDSFTRNDTQFLDVKNLMESDIKTFELIEKSVEFATNKIFNHIPELSVTGQQIFKNIIELKAKKLGIKKSKTPTFASNVSSISVSLSNTEIEAISRSINLIIATDAVNKNISWKNGKPLGIKAFEKLLFANLPNYRNKFQNNKFLNALQRTSKKDDFTIKLADDYNYSKLSESELNEIRNDFDKLPSGLKNAFTLYSFQKYGLGISTFKGNFFSLFSLDHRVDISNLISNEVEKWQQGFVSEGKIKDVINWIALINKNTIGKISTGEKVQGALAEKYDVNINPLYDISNEALREITDVNSIDDLNAILTTEGISKKLFDKEFLAEKRKVEGKLTINQYAKDLLEKREKFVNFEKPTNIYNLVKKYKPCKF